MSLGDDVLYREPLLELAITHGLAPGTSRIIVRSMLATDYSAGGSINLDLLAHVAGI